VIVVAGVIVGLIVTLIVAALVNGNDVVSVAEPRSQREERESSTASLRSTVSFPLTGAGAITPTTTST